MICIKSFFDLNRILLLSIGLWPYERSKLVQLQLAWCFGILISSVVFQLLVFVTVECTPDLVIQVFSYVLFFAMYAINYNSFVINANTVKLLLDQLQQICNTLKDENEITIIKEYGNNAKRYTAFITLFHVSSLLSIICLPLLPRVLGIFLFIQETDMRSITEHVIPKYFFTSEKYFYFIVLHVNTVICIGGTTLVATGMMLVAYLKHVCGIFKIVSYRIEKAMRINMQENVSLKDELIIYKEIIYAVDIHRKAIKFSEFILSSFQGSHFCLIMVGVVCLSLNLYGISVTVSLGNDIEQCLVHLTIVSIIFIYMFLANYAGQEVIDHNDNVYSTVYNVRWYVAPLHVQRLILFLLQRGSKAVSLNLGGMFVMSLELFATLTKASISYFTVVYSMQQ